jgi:hypothetical protein
MGGKPKGQDPQMLARMQRQAAEAEQKKIATQAAEQKARENQELQKSYAEKMSQRQEFAAGIANIDDDENRKKFLKGV